MLSNGSRTLAVLSLIVSGFAFTGCSFSSLPLAPDAPTTQTPIGALHGTTYGGQQPINGSHVYLYANGTAGYGTAATSLLQASANTTVDGNGNYYVTTDAYGSFNLTGDYTCTSGTQVYIYAIGGDPGAGTNTAAGLLAALGQCPATGTLAGQVPALNVDEVSTIATAYAMAGYAVDPTHVAHSGTALAATGIANAFANVPNLINIGTGLPNSTTPAGNGTVPATRLNTLGNILSACINSSSATSTQCNLLFANATIDGTSTGAKPTDTAMAAIYLAHNPGKNVTTLFNLQPASGAPFNPQLSAAPSDLTVSISFTGAGMSTSPHVAVDGSGNVWTTPDGTSVVTKISPLGAAISGASGFTGTGLLSSKDIAIDATGNAVALGSYSTTVIVLTTYYGQYVSIPSTGTGASTHSFGAHPLSVGIALDGSGNMNLMDSTLGNLMTVSSAGSTIGTMLLGGLSAGTNYAAIDGSGNVWSTNGNNSLSKFSSSFVALSLSGGYTGGGLNSPTGLVIDSSNNMWMPNSGANSISEFNASGTAVSTSTGYTGGGLSKPVALATDGAGHVWAANSGANTISEFTGSGTAVTGTTGFTDTSLNKPSALAIDGSGNVWVGNTNASGLTEFIGAAAPVVTPLAYAVKNNIIGTRP